MSGIIASELVGDQPPGFAPLPFEQATEKPLSCLLIATALYEDINDIAVLVHGTPQIMTFPLNGAKDFVDVPGIP